MKKILILLTFSLLLFSCGKQENNTVVDTNVGIVDENIDTEVSLEDEIPEYNEELVENEVKNELVEITHNNFKPLLENLEQLSKEEIDYYDCESYFYLSEPENRPDYQLSVQKEYIDKCEEMKK